MALGALSVSESPVGLGGGAGTAPSTGLGFLKETFGSIKKSLGRMVGLQEKDTKVQQEQLEKLEFLDDGAQGPVAKDMAADDLVGVDTDDKTYSNFVAKAEGIGTGILDSIKEAFDKVSFGEKMMAIVLAGGFFIFSKYKDKLTKVLTPVVQFVMDIVKFLGPEGAFMAFLGGFILLKSGLAKKAVMAAGSFILKTIKASAASLDRQGGLFKAMGNGFEAINKGIGKGVKQLKNIGGMITGGLTKGLNALGAGLKSLRIGIVSMSTSLKAMLVPFLPAIAIAAAVVAVFFSLKSGFETFKQSLEDGDSMFTAVLKGLGDAMLTLVTLPFTLVKNLTGYIAGLFGFDNFKEKLDSIDVKQAIVNAFKRLTGGMVMTIKAIAKGAAAALSAVVPGGKTPQEEFARVYAEVMAGGNINTSSAVEGSDYQGDQSSKDFNKDLDETSGYGNMDTSEMNIGGDEGMGTGNKFAVSYYQKQAEMEAKLARDRESGYTSIDSAGIEKDRLAKLKRDKEDEDYLNDITGPVYKADGTLDTTDYMAEMMKTASFKTSLSTKRTLRGEDGKVLSESGQTIVIKGGNVQGDTVNQMSQTNVTGPLEVNNTEMTQKIIQEHF